MGSQIVKGNDTPLFNNHFQTTLNTPTGKHEDEY
ncbi:hypothetical protein SAMN04489800_4295 [Pseudomonas deceptionensis]|uniref:Uncharacterized protein n=1 Tax=Pseudomonas deceptionensis TaxID=882211 RepID=A0A1H5NZT4_PSEDM|nr:hypothetical protein SAMN04489800_4295 [Pseudomonas deceptionensis]